MLTAILNAIQLVPADHLISKLLHINRLLSRSLGEQSPCPFRERCRFTNNCWFSHNNDRSLCNRTQSNKPSQALTQSLYAASRNGHRTEEELDVVSSGNCSKGTVPSILLCTLGNPQARLPPTETPNTPPQIHLQDGPQYGRSRISNSPKKSYHITRRDATTVSLPLTSSKHQRNGIWTVDYISHCAASNAEQHEKEITKDRNRRNLRRLSNPIQAVK